MWHERSANEAMWVGVLPYVLMWRLITKGCSLKNQTGLIKELLAWGYASWNRVKSFYKDWFSFGVCNVNSQNVHSVVKFAISFIRERNTFVVSWDDIFFFILNTSGKGGNYDIELE